VREVDHPPPFGGGVGFGPILVPFIGAYRHDHARVDLERGVEMLELRNDVPLEMLSRFGAHVEGRDEKAPILEAISEIGDVFGLELEEELADAPLLGPRLKRNARVRLSDSQTWHKPERWVEIVADLLPAEPQVPAIVGIREGKSTRVIFSEFPVVASLREQLEREVLVAVGLRGGKSGSGSEKVVVTDTVGIPRRDDRTNPGLV